MRIVLIKTRICIYQGSSYQSAAILQHHILTEVDNPGHVFYD